MAWLKTASTICFKPFSLSKAIEGLAAAGFTNVELSAVKGSVEHLDPDDLSSAAIRRAERVLAQYDVRPVSISGHCELFSDEGLARHRRVLQAAHGLGAKAMVTYVDGRAEGVTAWAAFRDNVHRIADEAQSMNISLCLENHSPGIATAHDAVRAIGSLGHSWLRLNYDTGNASYLAGVRPDEDIECGLPILGHVHLKDQRGGRGSLQFPPLGQGDLDIPALLAKIAVVDFTGPVSLEVEVCMDVTWPSWDECVAAVTRSSEYWDSIAV